MQILGGGVSLNIKENFMAVPRIRHVNTVDEMERLSDEFVTQGYTIINRGETSILVKRKAKRGGKPHHLIIFIFFGWWTLGLANLIYQLIPSKIEIPEDNVLIQVNSK